MFFYSWLLLAFFASCIATTPLAANSSINTLENKSILPNTAFKGKNNPLKLTVSTNNNIGTSENQDLIARGSQIALSSRLTHGSHTFSLKSRYTEGRNAPLKSFTYQSKVNDSTHVSISGTFNSALDNPGLSNVIFNITMKF